MRNEKIIKWCLISAIASLIIVITGGRAWAELTLIKETHLGSRIFSSWVYGRLDKSTLAVPTYGGLVFLDDEGTITGKTEWFCQTASHNGRYFQSGKSVVMDKEGNILYKPGRLGSLSNTGRMAVLESAGYPEGEHYRTERILFYDSSGTLLNEFVLDPALIGDGGGHSWSWSGDLFFFGPCRWNDPTKQESLMVFDKNGNRIWGIREDLTSYMRVATSRVGNRIAVCGGGTIYFYDTKGNIIAKYPASGISRIVLSPMGKYAVAKGKEKFFVINAETGDLVWQHNELRNLGSVDISLDGQRVVATTRKTGGKAKVIVLDKSGKIIAEQKVNPGGINYITSVQISDDGRKVFADGQSSVFFFEVK